MKDFGIHTIKERGAEIVVGNKAKFHGGECVLSNKDTDNLMSWSKLTKQEFEKSVNEDKIKALDELINECKLKDKDKKNEHSYTGYATGTDEFPSHFMEGDCENELVIGQIKFKK